MSIVNAEPIFTDYKNQGEYGYKLGVAVVKDGSPVTIPGDVNLIYYSISGARITVAGSSAENIAYYDVLATDFIIPGSYRYWIECFDLNIYGPFELKILKV